MDSDASMRSLFPSERPGDRHRSGPHERLGPQGNGAEDRGLLGDPAVLGGIIGRIWIRTTFSARGSSRIDMGLT
jgi:hypothetical protein